MATHAYKEVLTIFFYVRLRLYLAQFRLVSFFFKFLSYNLDQFTINLDLHIIA